MTFKVGDRAWAVEHHRLVKVLDMCEHSDGMWYYVRDFDHPHDLYWVNHHDIDRVSDMTHDPIRGERARGLGQV